MREQLLAQVDESEIIQLAMDLVAIPSPVGGEERAAEFVVNWLRERGFEAWKQQIEPGRANAIGVLRGKGTGKSLMFNAHLDTAFSGEQEDLNILGDFKPSDLPKPFIENDRICGQGIVNDKGPMAAFLGAASAVKRSGVELKGDLWLTCVAGEIGRAQIDEYQGPRYRSKGLGTRHMLESGIRSDFVLVAEPSKFGLTWALPGVFYVKIRVRGEAKYTPFTERPKNAIRRMYRVLEAIERWADIYESKYMYKFARGTIVPKVNVGAIRAGAPFKPNTSPGDCSIYVDVRVPPQLSPWEVMRELSEVVAKVDNEAEVTPYLVRRGYEAQGVEELVKAIDEAHVELFGSPPPPIEPGYTSMWNDNNVFCEFGMPVVKWGPSPRDSSGDYSCLSKAELLDAAKLYALVALKICGC